MLMKEIQETQNIIKTDAYQMSIGEIVSMYKDEELVVNPDFQRLFRWDIGQKSRLVESILLGIPIPSIFVFETEGGKWELVDGLQRISTLVEFMGLLRDPDDGTLLPPSKLTGTKYLPSLDNTVWQLSDFVDAGDQSEQIELEKSLQLAVRRARLGVEILKRPSSNNTKYELFQRLNAGGTQANAQELRNCVMIMVNPTFFQGVKQLSDDPDFRLVLGASEDQIEKQRHLEYATRFIVHVFSDYNGRLDVEDFIDASIVAIEQSADLTIISDVFQRTFCLLANVLGNEALRRYDGHRHLGRVGLAAFECIAVGVGRNIDAIEALEFPDRFLREKVKNFWAASEITRFMAPGLRGTVRLQRTISFGTEHFKP